MQKNENFFDTCIMLNNVNYDSKQQNSCREYTLITERIFLEMSKK